MAGDSPRVVRTGDRPDLIPIVTQWLWDEFWRDAGVTLDHVAGLVAQATADIGPNQTFVLLVEGKPVGTASLVANDLDERPDLTPWLAGVVVDRAVRGLGMQRR